jgi:hypothetical protein
MVRCEIGAVDLQAARDEFLGLMGWIGVVVGSEDRKAALLRVSFKGAVKKACEELESGRARERECWSVGTAISTRTRPRRIKMQRWATM